MSPQANQDAMSCTIDYTSFPHIISAVLAHSSLPSLTAFRQTSRFFKHSEEITRIMNGDIYLHLVLTNVEQPRPKWLERPKQQYQLVPFVKVPLRHPPIGLPIRPSKRDDASLLSLTKILDISVSDYYQKYPSFPSLEVVRVFERGNQIYPLPACNTVVIKSGGGGAKDFPVLIDPSHLTRLVLPAFETSFPEDSPTINSGISRLSWTKGGTVEDLVLLRKGVGNMDETALFNFVQAVIYFTGCLWPQTNSSVAFQRIVVVDIQEEEFLKHWDAYPKLTYSRSDPNSASARDGLTRTRDKCHFYTREEYSATLGKDDLWLKLES